jgi:hypothetical protein
LGIAALLFLACLIVFTDRYVKDRRQVMAERKREEMAERLAAVVEQAAQEKQARSTAAENSSALTAVLPAIRAEERGPRRVA